MNFESFNKSENIEISDDVQTQLENLGLKVEDIQGKILDVGAGDGQFAKELQKIVDAEIVSVDSHIEEDSDIEIIKANAKGLPFDNDSFDGVISHASMPNVFVGMYSSEFPEHSTEEIKKSISAVFNEMLRVCKPNSRVIMSPVRIANNYEPEKVMASVVNQVIDELEEQNINASFEMIREVENPINGEKHKEYRLILSKK